MLILLSKTGKKKLFSIIRGFGVTVISFRELNKELRIRFVYISVWYQVY